MFCHACLGSGFHKGGPCVFCNQEYDYVMEKTREFTTLRPSVIVCACKQPIYVHKMEFDEKTKKYKRWMRVMCDGQRVKVNGEC